MTLIDGLLLGFIGLIVYVGGFLVAYIVYEKGLKKEKRLQEEKESQIHPYEFK